jgi:hypothetical protein
MDKAIEEGMENLNERLKKANQFPHGPFHHDLLEIEHLDYCVKMAEIQVQQAQLHLQSARHELSEFPARTPEHRWRALPTLGGVKFTNWDDLDAFSSLMSDHPFLNEFAAFCAEVQIVEKPRRVPSSAPCQRATHWLAGPLVQRGDHGNENWMVDWLAFPHLSSYATCYTYLEKGQWVVSTTDQHRLGMPSNWNVRHR